MRSKSGVAKRQLNHRSLRLLLSFAAEAYLSHEGKLNFVFDGDHAGSPLHGYCCHKLKRLREPRAALCEQAEQTRANKQPSSLCISSSTKFFANLYLKKRKQLEFVHLDLWCTNGAPIGQIQPAFSFCVGSCTKVFAKLFSKSVKKCERLRFVRRRDL